MEIKFANNNDEREQVAKLSKAFAEEGICNGVVADDYEFLDRAMQQSLKEITQLQVMRMVT